MKRDHIYPHDLPAVVFALRVTAFVVTAVILWGTLWPTVSMPTVNITFSDKVWHVLAFWIWAGVVALGWPSLGWRALAGAALVGATIELVQPLVGRQAELADLGADLLGAALGAWSARRLLRRIATRRSVSGMSPQVATERQSGSTS
jgi:VanZ family protein